MRNKMKSSSFVLAILLATVCILDIVNITLNSTNKKLSDNTSSSISENNFSQKELIDKSNDTLSCRTYTTPYISLMTASTDEVLTCLPPIDDNVTSFSADKTITSGVKYSTTEETLISQINTLNNDNFTYKGEYTSTQFTDCNEIVENGIYSIRNSTGISNLPKHSIWPSVPCVGNLIVFSNNSTTTPRICQFLLGSDMKLHYRYLWKNTRTDNRNWSKWDIIPVESEIQGMISALETTQSNVFQPIDFGFIEKFAVIGDSYASGEIYVADSSAASGYRVRDYYNLSWGQIIARKYGAECINLSKGGLTTRTWLTDSKGLPAMLAAEPQQLYLCALGINDEINSAYGLNYLGSLTDITNYSDYENYADTFYGNYGRIIEQIQQHSPNAKIVLMSVAYLYNNTEDSFNNAIREIAEHYGLPFIDIKSDSFYSQTSIYKTGQSWNHPTAPIYAGMANANVRLFNTCVGDNYDYFKDFVG